MEQSSKIYVAGHRGLVGSAIIKNLKKKGYNNIITRTHKELDLTNQAGLVSITVNDNSLTLLDVRNGNNVNKIINDFI